MTFHPPRYTRRDFPSLSLRDALITITHWRKIDVRVRYKLYAFHDDNRREWCLWWHKDLRPARKKLLRMKRCNLAVERASERRHGPWPF